MEIKKLLEVTINKKASDLHLIVGVPPMLRINGVLLPIAGLEPLTAEQAQELVLSLVNDEQKEILLVNKELDFSFAFRYSLKTYYFLTIIFITAKHKKLKNVRKAWI